MKLRILMTIITLLLLGAFVMADPVPPYLTDTVGKAPDMATLKSLKGEERSTFLQSWVMLQFHYTGKVYNDAEQIVLPQLSAAMRNHYFVFWIGYQVCNSGLSGYWDFSEPPNFTQQAVAAFIALGAPMHARQIEQSEKLFRKHYAIYKKVVDTEKEDAVYDAFEEDLEQMVLELGELDWFLLNERLNYIEKHIDEFQNSSPNKTLESDE